MNQGREQESSGAPWIQELLDRVTCPQVDRILVIPSGGVTRVREQRGFQFVDLVRPLSGGARMALCEALRPGGEGLPPGDEIVAREGDLARGAWTVRLDRRGTPGTPMVEIVALKGVSGVAYSLRCLEGAEADRLDGSLGLDHEERAWLEAALGAPGGLILLACPPGQGGKALAGLASLRREVFPLVVQFQEGTGPGVTGAFQLSPAGERLTEDDVLLALGLRPDLLVLGPTRDFDLLPLAVQAALQGTKVLMGLCLPGRELDLASWNRILSGDPRLPQALHFLVHQLEGVLPLLTLSRRSELFAGASEGNQAIEAVLESVHARLQERRRRLLGNESGRELG